MTLISTLSIICYLATGFLLVHGLLKYPDRPCPFKQYLLIPGLLGLILHAGVLYNGIFTPSGLDVSFFQIFSLVGWLVALLLLTSALRQPIEYLGIIVMPFTALALLLEQMTDQHHYLPQHFSAGLEFHILISILAYSLLSVAMVQALLLHIQDAHLHNKHPGGFIRALPPLQTMETMLFRMIGLGFIILSASLLSGFIFLENMFAQHLVHKTFLSIVAWLLYATLLWGRWQFGWRGRTAIRWAVSGFIALMLAYFGSKFVIELILQR
ncbi:MAG: cytochrome c biogenesis protein CcsA [Gammaproteobacteria bacterium]|nr:cytochrome c biogenesis protein CcsA [Gammaproteobacteria bacterium]